MRARGSRAEDTAADFLQQQGLTLVERNYRCRFGEIDLIARDGEMLVFIEVRLRSSRAFGGAAASITAAKRHKLLLTARHYLAGRRRTPACRFDAVLLAGDAAAPEWLKNVFGE
jgi:putative endonuclease